MTGAEMDAALAVLGMSRREFARQIGRNQVTVVRWAQSQVPEAVAEWLRRAVAWREANPPPRRAA